MTLGTAGSRGLVMSLGLHVAPSTFCSSAHDGEQKQKTPGTNLAIRVGSTVLQKRTSGRLLSLATRPRLSTSLLPVRWSLLTSQVWVMGSSHLFGDKSLQGMGMGFPRERIILLSKDGRIDAKHENNRCLQIYWATTLWSLLCFNWMLWILSNTSR